MSKKKILVVEDEDDVRSIMVKVLSQNYEVSSAVDGEDALRVAKDIKPDLIISDVIMPKKDGNQFFKELRQTDWGGHIPFIILTARGKMRDYFEVMAVDNFLEKPCPPEQLIKTIEESLAKAESASAEKGDDGSKSAERSAVARPELRKSAKARSSLKPKLLVIEPDLRFGEELCKWLVEYDCCLIPAVREFENVPGFTPDLIVMRKEVGGLKDEKELNRIQRKGNAEVIVYEHIGDLDLQQKEPKLVFNEEGRKLVWHINALAQQLKDRK